MWPPDGDMSAASSSNLNTTASGFESEFVEGVTPPSIVNSAEDEL